MSLLKQNTTKKQRVDKRVTELKTGDSKKYEVEVIWDNAVYANKSKSGQLLGLYYLVAWNDHSKEKNTWELLSAVQHLKKLISCFYKKNLKKPTAISLPIKSAPPIARSTIRPIFLKRKWGQPAGIASKQAKNWVLDASDI